MRVRACVCVCVCVCGNCAQKLEQNLKWSLKKLSEDAIGLTSFIRRTTVFC